MKTALVVLLALSGFALMVYSWFAVGAEDAQRDQLEASLQGRSLDAYRQRAKERAADPTRRPDPAHCHGRVRHPIPLEARPVSVYVGPSRPFERHGQHFTRLQTPLQ